jgi:hypothetical protein
MSLASVTIDHVAFSDPRIAFLGELGGYSHMEALGRIARLWARCTFLQSDVLPEFEIAACVGPGGGPMLVKSGLGEQLESGDVRVRGRVSNEGKDRHGWFGEQKQGRSVGGRARANNAPRDARGRLISRDAGSSNVTSKPPATHFAGPAAGPISGGSLQQSGFAGTSKVQHHQLSGSGSGSPEEDLSPGQASGQNQAPLPPEPLGRREPAAPRRNPDVRRGQLAIAALNHTARTQQQLKAEGIDPTAPNIGVLPNGEDYGWQQLLDRTQELLNTDPDTAGEVLTRRIDVAAAEARRDRTLRWFTTAALWTAKSFAIGAAMSPEQASQPRVGPTSSGRFGDRHGAEAEPPRRIKTL